IGLSKGKMSIVSPLAAVISVIIPVLYSALNEGIPSIFKIAGFTFAFIGIWFIVSTNFGPHLKGKDLRYPVLAGIFFGFFFISIDNFSATAIYWPLTVSRITAFIMITAFIILTNTVSKPTSNVILVVILAGLLNTGGATFFALASEAGRLDVATILSSLSPAVTVLLACILLKEQLAPRQWIGVIATLIAIIFISI
ncbi:MAG: EamA family transporter, partial [Halobacteriota archaeon]